MGAACTNRFSGLRCKEVVSICSGCRLGFVSDVEVDWSVGRILALVVPGPGRCFGLLGRQEDLVIPWCSVRRIGNDIILVEGDPEKFRLPRPKRSIF